MKSNNDNKILSLLKGGGSKDEAFTLLVNLYKQKLYFIVRTIVVSHEDAEDALQETLLKVYRHLHKFKAQSSLYTWLYTIATHEALRINEKKKKHKKENLEKVERNTEDKIWNDDAERINILLTKAIFTLPEAQRIVFSLRYFENLPYGEIEKICGKSVNTLKVSYHIAEKKIKEYIYLHNYD